MVDPVGRGISPLLHTKRWGTTYYSTRCHARQAITCGTLVLKFSTQFQRPPSALSSMISYIEGVATSTSPLKMSHTQSLQVGKFKIQMLIR